MNAPPDDAGAAAGAADSTAADGSLRKLKLSQVCANYDPRAVHHSGTTCNCTKESLEQSQLFTGRAPVYFPFLKDSHYVSPDLDPNASLTFSGWW